MGWNEYRRINKSKKNHFCECCQQTIPIGSAYTRFVGHWEGDFQNWCLCDFCDDYRQHFNLDWSEGISCLWDELRDDSLYDKKCAKCGHGKVRFEYSTAQDYIEFYCGECGHKESMALRKAVGMKLF